MDRALRLRRAAAVLLACVVALGTGIGLHASGTIQHWEDDAIDWRFDNRGVEVPEEVAVVAVDDLTFSVLERQWPFPRSMHGTVIDRLTEAGAKVIVYDVQFTEPTTTEEDMALFEAARRSGRVVFATSEIGPGGATRVLGGDDNVRLANARVGAVNLPPGNADVVRRMSYESGGLRSLAVVAAELATGRAVDPRSFPDDGALIDFRGPPQTIPTVPFHEVHRGTADPDMFRGKVVVVGASAPSLGDVHATPTSGGRPMAGPEVLANAIWTVMAELPLRHAPPWAALVCVVALALVAPLAGTFLRPVPAGIVAACVGGIYAAAAFLMFTRGVIVPVAAPLAALAVGIAGMLVARYLLEERERVLTAALNARLEERVRERTAELRATQLEIISRLAQAAESREELTGRHIERVAKLVRALALALGIPAERAELIATASELHDVGKIGIPDRILLKPGRLDPEELAVMRTHPTIGGDILAGSSSELVRTAERIARTHHERWDGNGYPEGLAGGAIPVEGRICAICDVFDALVTPRQYKGAWSLEDALAAIREDAGHTSTPPWWRRSRSSPRACTRSSGTATSSRRRARSRRRPEAEAGRGRLSPESWCRAGCHPSDGPRWSRRRRCPPARPRRRRSTAPGRRARR